MKTKIIPFDLETAKKIQSGEVEGRIVTDNGAATRILCYDFKCGEYNIGVAVSVRDGERFCCITKNGLRSTVEHMNDGWFDKLIIELPKEAPKTQADLCEEAWLESKKKHDFNPFDKVMVRCTRGDEMSEWKPSLFVKYYPCALDGEEYFETIGEHFYSQCIPKAMSIL